MAASVFDDIIKKGLRAGQFPGRTQQARKWYRETASKFSSMNENRIIAGDKTRLVNNPIIGSMYMFYYAPKTAESLPFYDTFPLVFPFERAPQGFMGLNMHYLPPQLRAKLMDGLYEYANNDYYDETTKLQMNYEMLRRASNLRFFKPCVKRYLSNHMRSKFIYIKPDEWDIALFLPTERFQKQTKEHVWNISKKISKR